MILLVNLAMLAVMLAPILMVVWISFTPAPSFVLPLHQLSWRWYREAASYPQFADAFLLSAKLAAIAASCATAMSFLAAYALVRFRPRGAGAVMGLATSPLLVPAVVYGIAMLQFANATGLYDSLAGLVIAHTVLVVPFAIRSLEVTLRGVPQELEWAAGSLGASRARLLLWITLPLCGRGLVAAFLFGFLLSFSEVTVTIFMAGPTQQTLPIRIYSYMSDRIDPTVAAVSSIVIVISVALAVLFSLAGGLRRGTSR